MKGIPPNKNVFIAGRNGSGKSQLARAYLSTYDNVVLLDTKGTEDWEKDFPEKTRNKEITVVEHLKDLEMVDTKKIIYRPDYSELNEEYYEEFFRWLYFRKNTIGWIDEVMAVCKNAYSIPEYYRAILTRGRSRNTSVWSVSQRPSGIPILTMSEAHHFFVFDLNMEADRQKLASTTGAVELLEKPSKDAPKYSFWYYFVEEEHAYKGRLKLT